MIRGSFIGNEVCAAPCDLTVSVEARIDVAQNVLERFYRDPVVLEACEAGDKVDFEADLIEFRISNGTWQYRSTVQDLGG